MTSEPFAWLKTFYGHIKIMPDPNAGQAWWIINSEIKRNTPMTHENPTSLVPGSIHLNRNGKRVFIESVHVSAPWRTGTITRPITGFVEGEDIPRTYLQSGKWFYEYDDKESSTDLIREYKEPKTHTGYLIIWKSGDTAMTPNIEMAHESGKLCSAQGRNPYRIIKLTGTEDDEIVRSFDFNPLAHEQCK